MKPYSCQYCNNKFAKESTLAVHVCVQKQRALARTEKRVVIAFDTYNKFYKLTQNFNGDKTYDEFRKSPYYTAFVKFGSFVSNVNPLYPYKFIDYVIKSGIKLDHWCRDDVYEKYVLSLIKTEAVETALERSVTHMIDWSEKNNLPWNEYFQHVSLNRAMYDIKDGKISPWLLLNSTHGKNLVRQFDDSQLVYIGNILDPVFWRIKFERQAKDTILVKQVVKDGEL